jgi:hypothetical protein
VKKLFFILSALMISFIGRSQVTVVGTVIPAAGGTFAVTWDSLIQGGMQVVQDINARNNITTGRRREGMLVAVINSADSIFQLRGGTANSNWTYFASGISSITPGFGFTSNTPITSSGTLVIDSTKLSTVFALFDTSLTLRGLIGTKGSGTVTSITPAYGFTSTTPITTTGSLIIDSSKFSSIFALFDTSSVLRTILNGKGTVNSITPGYGFTSSTPITNTGTLTIDSSKLVTRFALSDSISSIQGRVNLQQVMTNGNTTNVKYIGTSQTLSGVDTALNMVAKDTSTATAFVLGGTLGTASVTSSSGGVTNFNVSGSNVFSMSTNTLLFPASTTLANSGLTSQIMMNFTTSGLSLNRTVLDQSFATLTLQNSGRYILYGRGVSSLNNNIRIDTGGNITNFGNDTVQGEILTRTGLSTPIVNGGVGATGYFEFASGNIYTAGNISNPYSPAYGYLNMGQSPIAAGAGPGFVRTVNDTVFSALYIKGYKYDLFIQGESGANYMTIDTLGDITTSGSISNFTSSLNSSIIPGLNGVALWRQVTDTSHAAAIIRNWGLYDVHGYGGAGILHWKIDTNGVMIINTNSDTVATRQYARTILNGTGSWNTIGNNGLTGLQYFGVLTGSGTIVGYSGGSQTFYMTSAAMSWDVPLVSSDGGAQGSLDLSNRTWTTSTTDTLGLMSWKLSSTQKYFHKFFDPNGTIVSTIDSGGYYRTIGGITTKNTSNLFTIASASSSDSLIGKNSSGNIVSIAPFTTSFNAIGNLQNVMTNGNTTTVKYSGTTQTLSGIDSVMGRSVLGSNQLIIGSDTVNGTIDSKTAVSTPFISSGATGASYIQWVSTSMYIGGQFSNPFNPSEVTLSFGQSVAGGTGALFNRTFQDILQATVTFKSSGLWIVYGEGSNSTNNLKIDTSANIYHLSSQFTGVTTNPNSANGSTYYNSSTNTLDYYSTVSNTDVLIGGTFQLSGTAVQFIVPKGMSLVRIAYQVGSGTTTFNAGTTSGGNDVASAVSATTTLQTLGIGKAFSLSGSQTIFLSSSSSVNYSVTIE